MLRGIISLAAVFCTPLPSPPLGYSTWQYATGSHWGKKMGQYVSVNESVCREQADAMVKQGLVAKGYTVFIVDEPCFSGRDASGKLLANANILQRLGNRYRGKNGNEIWHTNDSKCIYLYENCVGFDS